MPASLIVGLFFITWDYIFTIEHIWGFSERYTLRPRILQLPIEEIAFFFVVPYASIFTYYCLNYTFNSKTYQIVPGPATTNSYPSQDTPHPSHSHSSQYTPHHSHSQQVFRKFLNYLHLSVATFILVLLSLYPTHLYTLVTFLLTIIVGLGLFLKHRKIFNQFTPTYLLILIPFFLVNGALTGAFTTEPIVWYNNLQNTGIRIGTIPIEDIFYGYLLLLLNTTLFEYFKASKQPLHVVK